MRVGYRTDCTNTHHSHPEYKGAKKQSDYGPRKCIKQTNERRILLAGAFEDDRPDAGEERIYDERKHCAAEDRQYNVRHFQKRPGYRDDQPAAEKCGRVRRGKSSNTHKLTHQTSSPAAHDFEQNQNDSKGNEDGLPKWRTRHRVQFGPHFVEPGKLIACWRSA